jgi:hypothetical protein
VRDVIFLVLVLAFFALAALFVAGCARLIGRSDQEGSGS